MAKLNQIIAVENGVKTSSQRELTDAHHALQKPALLSGIARRYTPKDDEGEKLPDEKTKVQATAKEMVEQTAKILSRLFDITATKDWANCEAKGSVRMDGKVLLADVPITHLLFLEKRLVDLETFFKKLPTLDPSESWKFDPAQNCFASEPAETTKTKKIPRNHVKAEATQHHPAQVEVFQEDVIIGTWRTIKFSGALPATTVAELTDRVVRLREAVKFAREEANSIDVTDKKIAEPIFAYLLAPLAKATAA